jgi:hypothetical protein
MPLLPQRCKSVVYKKKTGGVMQFFESVVYIKKVGGVGVIRMPFESSCSLHRRHQVLHGSAVRSRACFEPRDEGGGR